MNNQDFKISFKTVWFLVVGNILLTVFGAFAKIQHWEYSQIYNKTFWIITMFIMPPIATIFYMIQRNKLIRLGEKLG